MARSPGTFARFWPVRCRCICGCQRPARRFRLSCKGCPIDRHPNPLCSYSRGAGEGVCVQTPVWRLLIDGRPFGDYCFQHRADMDEREEWIDRARIFPPGEREWVHSEAGLASAEDL